MKSNISKSKTNTEENYDLVDPVDCINTIRVLAADMVEKAHSGHPGAPMGCASIAHLLWSEFMVYNPENPKWINRDRFVLSNGHASALQYIMLHLTGYDLNMDELKNFRQKGSLTPGHPESSITPGFEVTTGPLGQGVSNAVGIAIGEENLRATYVRNGYSPIDHYTYVLCGDGCLSEGITAEASSIAGHLGLSRLIVIYDNNNVTIDGDTNISFTEDVCKRYESYNWYVQSVSDANDLESLRNAINNARNEKNRPSFISVRTIIGEGSARQGTAFMHGIPIGDEDLSNVKKLYGFDPTKFFFVPERVKEFYKHHGLEMGKIAEKKWNEKFEDYSLKYPELSEELLKRFNRGLPSDEKILSLMSNYLNSEEKKTHSIRECCGKMLDVLASLMPDIIGGTADVTPDIFSVSEYYDAVDLSPSLLSSLKCPSGFQIHNRSCRYIYYGVREHAMGGISNSLFAYGAFRPFCGTYLIFVEYMISAVRLAALSKFGLLFILTRDSINLGEDGPTHQPIETLETVRSFPNLLTFRPADCNEAIGSYLEAIKHIYTPSIISITSDTSPQIINSDINKVSLGAYVIHQTNSDNNTLSLVIISTGIEVNLSIQVAHLLATKYNNLNIRVVSCPCTQLFDKQPLDYQLEILPDGVPIMSIEMSTSSYWLRYAHAVVGIDRYGFSAPPDVLMDYFGFTVEKLARQAEKVLEFYKNKKVESKLIRPRFDNEIEKNNSNNEIIKNGGRNKKTRRKNYVRKNENKTKRLRKG